MQEYVRLEADEGSVAAVALVRGASWLQQGLSDGEGGGKKRKRSGLCRERKVLCCGWKPAALPGCVAVWLALSGRSEVRTSSSWAGRLRLLQALLRAPPASVGLWKGAVLTQASLTTTSLCTLGKWLRKLLSIQINPLNSGEKEAAFRCCSWLSCPDSIIFLLLSFQRLLQFFTLSFAVSLLPCNWSMQSVGPWFFPRYLSALRGKYHMERFIWKQFRFTRSKLFLGAAAVTAACGLLPWGVMEFIYSKHIKLNSSKNKQNKYNPFLNKWPRLR